MNIYRIPTVFLCDMRVTCSLALTLNHYCNLHIYGYSEDGPVPCALHPARILYGAMPLSPVLCSNLQAFDRLCSVHPCVLLVPCVCHSVMCPTLCHVMCPALSPAPCIACVLPYALPYAMSYVLSYALPYAMSYVLPYALPYAMSYVLSYALPYAMSYVLCPVICHTLCPTLYPALCMNVNGVSFCHLSLPTH